MINELAYCENVTSLSWKLLLYHAALLVWPTARFAPDVIAEDSFRQGRILHPWFRDILNIVTLNPIYPLDQDQLGSEEVI